MTTRVRILYRAISAGAAMLLIPGCDQVAFEPLHGRLSSQWTVNEEPACEVPRGVPVLVKVQVRNVYRWRVRMPKDAAPGLEGVRWKPLRPLPATLGAGAEAEAWWLMEGDLPAGEYEVEFGEGAAIAGTSATLRVSDAPVPAPLLLQQRAAVARLSGTGKEFVAELLQLPAEKMLPTTRLAIADLLRDEKEPDQAAAQLERFAEEVYGAEALPGWLQMRMRSSASPGTSLNP